MINYDPFLSRAGRADEGVGHPQDGHASLASGRDIISFAPGYPAPETFAWDEFRGHRRASSWPAATARVLQYGPTRGYRPLLEAIAAHHADARRRHGDRTSCSSPPARSRGSTWSRACCSIPATSSSSSCRPTSARSPRSATSRRTMVGVPQEADGIDLDALDDDLAAAAARRPARQVPLRRARTSRIRPGC